MLVQGNLFFIYFYFVSPFFVYTINLEIQKIDSAVFSLVLQGKRKYIKAL